MPSDRFKEATGLAALYYKVPRHANTLKYSLGGLTFFCFLVAMGSGILLSQFYSPWPATAYASVKYISATAGLKLLRGVHYWAANLGLALLVVHLLRVITTGAFRPPRLLTYFVGLAMLLVVFLIYFTGTTLRGDQESYEAMRHFTAVNKLFGPLGAFFQEDFTLSSPLLSRLFALHASGLQIVLAAVLVLHVFYIKYFGISPRPYQDQAQYRQSLEAGATFMGHAKLAGALSAAVFAAIVALAWLAPPALLGPPKAGMEMTRPAWPFWGFVPFENFFGIPGIPIGMGVVGAWLLSFPALALVIKDERRFFRATWVLVIAGLVFWAAMVIVAFVTPVQSHFGAGAGH